MIFVVLRMEADRGQTIGGGKGAGTNISDVPWDSYIRNDVRKIPNNERTHWSNYLFLKEMIIFQFYDKAFEK